MRMGLRRDLMDLAREYKKDPKGQYLRNLDKLLDLHTTAGVSPEEVFLHVAAWRKRLE
jgi:hypothetical protein